MLVASGASALAFTGAFSNGPYTASATIDPTFTVDPDFKDYSIAFSSGLEQVSAVPLPASAPMFGAALVALGAAGYGLRRKKVCAAA